MNVERHNFLASLRRPPQGPAPGQVAVPDVKLLIDAMISCSVTAHSAAKRWRRAHPGQPFTPPPIENLLQQAPEDHVFLQDLAAALDDGAVVVSEHVANMVHNVLTRGEKVDDVTSATAALMLKNFVEHPKVHTIGALHSWSRVKPVVRHEIMPTVVTLCPHNLGAHVVSEFGYRPVTPSGNVGRGGLSVLATSMHVASFGLGEPVVYTGSEDLAKTAAYLAAGAVERIPSRASVLYLRIAGELVPMWVTNVPERVQSENINRAERNHRAKVKAEKRQAGHDLRGSIGR